MAFNSYSNHKDDKSPSYGQALYEIISSGRELLQSDFQLFKAELRESAKLVGKHGSQLVAFGTIFALSILPLVAFLVIGLGEILDGRYWLSSLIVGVVFAVIGGIMTYVTYKKIKSDPVDFSHTKSSLRHELNSVQEHVEKAKFVTKGETYGTRNLRQV